MLTTAIILKRIELIKHIFEVTEEKFILTSVNVTRLSPISRILCSGNETMLKLVGEYIKKVDHCEKLSPHIDDYENLSDAIEYPMYENVSPMDILSYIPALYVESDLESIIAIATEMEEYW